MAFTSDFGRHRPRFGFGSILLANLIPLVGVLWLGWDPATLVMIYALELLFTFPLAGLKAVFAGRPPRTDRADSLDSYNASRSSTNPTTSANSSGATPWPVG